MSQDRPRRGLGRGLGSLIPTGPAPTGSGPNDVGPGQSDAADAPRSSAPAAPTMIGRDGTERPAVPSGAYFAEIPIARIIPNKVQPREVFDEDAMAELVHS